MEAGRAITVRIDLLVWLQWPAAAGLAPRFLAGDDRAHHCQQVGLLVHIVNSRRHGTQAPQGTHRPRWRVDDRRWRCRICLGCAIGINRGNPFLRHASGRGRQTGNCLMRGYVGPFISLVRRSQGLKKAGLFTALCVLVCGREQELNSLTCNAGNRLK